MNKQDYLIDKAVHELNGVLPDFKNEKYAMAKDALYMPFVKESFNKLYDAGYLRLPADKS